jgi:putative phosphoesterase
MRVGIFADTHDHLDNIRLAVAEFNRRECEIVLFAGDLVSTFAIPPFRKINCPMIASFGDNEGNKAGIRGGMQIIGEIGDPPFCFRLRDGKRVLLTHQRELIREPVDGVEIIVYAHTHKPRVHRDSAGRLWINPGETSGWTYGNPSIAILDTASMDAEVVWLNDVRGPLP